MLAALWIRKVQRPRRFEGSHLGEADLILGLIATIVITLLLWHASRIALGLNEWPRSWSPVSNALSHLFADNRRTRVLERVFVWAHVLTILAFLAYLPRSKHLHIATAAVNVWFGRTGPRGRLEPLRFDDDQVAEEDLRFGAGTAADLTWKQVLDTFSCTECGRCQDACPAFATGKSLSPKLVIMGLRDQVLAQEESPLVPGAVPEESVWDCVTCGACVQACPVSIEHVDHIVDLRRHLVMVESSFPAEAEPMLRDVERASNPWGKPQSERADWAAELGVRVLEPGDPAPEYLYWVGLRVLVRRACAPDRGVDREAAAGGGRRLRDPRAARELHRRPGAADGQRVRVPGVRRAERADAQRGGRDEDRRQLPALLQHARQRVPRLRRALRGRPPLRAAGRARARRPARSRRAPRGARSPTTTPATWPATTTCSRRRASWSRRSASRSRWSASGKPTFCCGAGGAHMWMEERGKPINEERVREAAGTGADTLAVACPYCTVMLDDGVQSAGERLEVVDVATLLSESISSTSPP